MALQAGAELPEGHHLGVRDRPRGLEHRVTERGCVTLGVDQVVVVGVLRLAPVVLEIAAEEHRDEVRRRHGGGGVTGPRRRAAANGIDPELLTELARELEICGRNLLGDRHVTPWHVTCEGPVAGGFCVDLLKSLSTAGERTRSRLWDVLGEAPGWGPSGPSGHIPTNGEEF